MRKGRRTARVFEISFGTAEGRRTVSISASAAAKATMQAALKISDAFNCSTRFDDEKMNRDDVGCVMRAVQH